MHKLLKWILAIVGIVVVLLGVTTVVLPMVIDPNNYKDEITAAVLKDTGRELTIGGEIKWSVFPTVGLELSDVSLGNPEGFGERSMLDIGEAGISVKFMPLLRRRVEIGDVSLNDVAINLSRKTNGKTNWGDLSKAGAVEKSPATATGRGMDSFVVSGIEIRNARVTFDDAGQTTELKAFDLKASNIELGRPFDLKGGFSINLPEQQLTGDIGFAGRVQTKATGQQFGVEGLVLSFKGKRGAGGGSVALDIEIDANADIDLSRDQAILSDFVLRFDESTFKGNLSIVNFDYPKLAFDLQVDRLNLDDYMSEDESTGGTGSESRESDLSVDVFRGFTGGGDLRIAQLVVAGLTATDVSMRMNSDGKTIRFSPVNARFYGGEHKGDITIDASGNRPLLVANHGLTGVQVKGLLSDLADADRLEGTGDFSLRITTDLSNSTSVMQKLSGEMAMSMFNGAIVGIDVAETINAVKSVLGKQDELVGESGGEQKTEFAELTMSGILERGILSSDDLLMLSPLIRATGKGSFNLVTESINYTLKPVLLGDLGKNLGKLSGKPVPIKLSGNLYEPDIRVDLVAALAESQKERINKKADELLGKLLGGKEDSTKVDSGTDESGTDDQESESEENADIASSLLKGLLGTQKESGKKDDEGVN